MPETKHKYPAEFYESGEAMPDLADVHARYSEGFQDDGIARVKEIMARQKAIEPTLKRFVKTGYRAVNKVLHGKPLFKGDAEFAKDMIAKIDAVLLSDFYKREQPLTVYRGITVEFAKNLDAALKADGLFSDPGYVLASTIERHALRTIQIELPIGVHCLSLHKFLANEVLLPRDSRFKVSSQATLPNGKVRFLASALL